VPPVDAFQDIRSAMCLACEEMGLKVEVHHHEVATAGQAEIGIAAGTLVQKADQVQILKYALQNVAHGYGKTVTFMPKPLVGDNGSGMHVHQSLQKEARALFAGDKYGGLSDLALYYIGGIIKHARALNAFTNAGPNSHKRLEPEEAKSIPTVCHSLDMALENLDRDREFLTRGGVFTNDVIDAYATLKQHEITRFRMSTHPVELEMYYSV